MSDKATGRFTISGLTASGLRRHLSTMRMYLGLDVFRLILVFSIAGAIDD
jgi:hypothetical protein